MATGNRSLATHEGMGKWGSTKAGRLLQAIRRDMDAKKAIFERRKRNEEILALAYSDGTVLGGDYDWNRIREDAVNLPYRLVRWYESQATSKKMVVKVDRDAGPGQRQGGPGDDQTGMWVGITLRKTAYQSGFKREMKALINEVIPRGTSVLRIGFHKEAISLTKAAEVGKGTQSIIPDVLMGETEAIEGQAHAQIASELSELTQDEEVRRAIGPDKVEAMEARIESHLDAKMEAELDESPSSSSHMIRRRVWMQKRRVGEDVGWAPWVYDTESTPWWWELHKWTVAEVKASDMFTEEFKRAVKGYDARNMSEIHEGGETPSTESMDSDAREAQGEDILDDDERIVEWIQVWMRRPDMLSGGVVKIVAPEMPDKFVHSDDSNPHVDENGKGLIPGFYPFYDFTPVLSSLTVPARTTGIPPMAVGMTQFEKIAELNHLIHASAIRHSIRFYDIHPAHKDNKPLMRALQNGEDGYAQVMKSEQFVGDRPQPSVYPIQFTGNTDNLIMQKSSETSDWVMMQGMPPAVLQGVGTAKTATQDTQGIAAGERESGTMIEYFEDRMGDVLAGMRGLIRGHYDDATYRKLLGEVGSQVMIAWAKGTEDDGDEISVTFGMRAYGQMIALRKQLMEAITLIRMEIEPLTQLPIYDRFLLVEELFRTLDVGKPQMDERPMKQLQQMVLMLGEEIRQIKGQNPITKEGELYPEFREEGEPSSYGGPKKPAQGRAPTSGEKKESRGGPNPSEGDGPTQGNILAGATRGTASV